MPLETADTVQDEFEAEFAKAKQGTSAAPDLPDATVLDVAPPPAGEASPSVAPPALAAPAPAEQLTPEQRLERAQQEIAELKHRERSVANRLAPVDRKNRQLEGMVSELQAKIEQLSAAGPAPAATHAAAPAAKAADADVAGILNDAPELREAIENLLNARTAKLEEALAKVATQHEALVGKTSGIEQSLAPLAGARHVEEIERTHAELDKLFTPSWRTQVLDNPEFADWLSAQPEAIQRLGSEAVSVRDTEPVVRLYLSSKGQATAPAPTPLSPGATTLRRAAGIPSSPGTAPRGAVLADDDYEGHFAAAQRKLRGR